MFMHAWPGHMHQLHRFMIFQSLYPIILSSLLACGIFAGRVYLSRSYTYGFLVWNLFLAWVPYVCSFWITYLHRRHPRRWWYLVIPAGLWLIFFPNAPYILTDLWHLRTRPPVPAWYDLGLFIAFAWTGCFLAIVSLRVMQTLVRARAGWLASWVFVIATLGLSGLGIYMGRFLGWNSWDLILHPRSILADVSAWLVHPRGHLQMYGFTVLFTAVLLVCYLTFTSLQHHEQP
jgi:uncharacterized membrane protein